MFEDLFWFYVGELVIVFVGFNEMVWWVLCYFLILCLLSYCGKVEWIDIFYGFELGDYFVLVVN